MNHGGKRTRRPVVRDDGTRYCSIAEAARAQYGSPAPENIGLCCRGVRKTAYGYAWRYADAPHHAKAHKTYKH